MNFKKSLSVVLTLGIVSTLFLGVNNVKAASIDNPESVISEYVSALNNKDWDKLVNLQNDESLKSFIESKSNQDQKLGILDVKSAKLKNVLPIPNSEATKFLSDNYDGVFNLEYYLVATDYNVYNENKYYVNGTNYDLLAIGKLNGQWKIINGMMAPLDVLHNDGYGFFDKAENDTITVIQQRIHGKIVNKSGKLLEYDNANFAFQLEQAINPLIKTSLQADSAIKVTASNPGYNFNLPFPQQIRVYITSAGYVSTVATWSYVKDVLPNEWHGSDPVEALKAGAIAVKEYAWYHHYYPTINGSRHQADLIDTPQDQKYVWLSRNNPGCGNSNTACDAIYRWAIVNSSGNVFETNYQKTPRSGWMSQDGSVNLAKQGYSWISILQYYYKNITKQYIGNIPQS